MPYAIVLTTYDLKTPSLRSINGAQLQGAFLDLIRRIAPELSTELHAGDALRPYALSMLLPGYGQESARLLSRLVLRIACLDDRIYPALVQNILVNEKESLRIGKVEFCIAELIAVSEKKPTWVGFATYQDIITSAQEAADQSNFIEIEFATPTIFTQGPRGDTPLPLPESVFGGLARRWNSAPEVPLLVPDGFQNEVYEYVTVSRFHGETLTVDIGDQLKKTGFVGRVTYRIHNPKLLFWCHLMGESSFFSGLGAKTSRGLGCVRKVHPASK
ncbi:MAG: CRISPR system precrRNA processing endoribonuclease RAMP protein Cas6 [Acidobacteriota bacterium]